MYIPDPIINKKPTRVKSFVKLKKNHSFVPTNPSEKIREKLIELGILDPDSKQELTSNFLSEKLSLENRSESIKEQNPKKEIVLYDDYYGTPTDIKSVKDIVFQFEKTKSNPNIEFSPPIQKSQPINNKKIAKQKNKDSILDEFTKGIEEHLKDDNKKHKNSKSRNNDKKENKDSILDEFTKGIEEHLKDDNKKHKNQKSKKNNDKKENKDSILDEFTKGIEEHLKDDNKKHKNSKSRKNNKKENKDSILDEFTKGIEENLKDDNKKHKNSKSRKNNKKENKDSILDEFTKGIEENLKDDNKKHKNQKPKKNNDKKENKTDIPNQETKNKIENQVKEKDEDIKLEDMLEKEKKEIELRLKSILGKDYSPKSNNQISIPKKMEMKKEEPKETESKKEEDKEIELKKEEPKPKKLVTQATALINYTAKRDVELSFKKGDIITVLEKSSTGWWQGITKNGEIGIFLSVFASVKEMLIDDDGSDSFENKKNNINDEQIKTKENQDQNPNKENSDDEDIYEIEEIKENPNKENPDDEDDEDIYEIEEIKENPNKENSDDEDDEDIYEIEEIKENPNKENSDNEDDEDIYEIEEIKENPNKQNSDDEDDEDIYEIEEIKEDPNKQNSDNEDDEDIYEIEEIKENPNKQNSDDEDNEDDEIEEIKENPNKQNSDNEDDEDIYEIEEIKENPNKQNSDNEDDEIEEIKEDPNKQNSDNEDDEDIYEIKEIKENPNKQNSDDEDDEDVYEIEEIKEDPNKENPNKQNSDDEDDEIEEIKENPNKQNSDDEDDEDIYEIEEIKENPDNEDDEDIYEIEEIKENPNKQNSDDEDDEDIYEIEEIKDDKQNIDNEDDESEDESEDEYDEHQNDIKAIVIENYKGVNDSEISLTKGDIVYIYGDLGQGWAQGETKDGIIGKFPLKYVEYIDKTQDITNKELNDQITKETTYNTTSKKSKHKKERQKITETYENYEDYDPDLDHENDPKVRALSDYTPQRDNELSYKQGDILYVTGQSEVGWWQGETRDGLIGIFHSQNFEVVDEASRINLNKFQEISGFEIIPVEIPDQVSTPDHLSNPDQSQESNQTQDPILFTSTSIYSYQPQSETDLDFGIGEEIQIMAQDDSGWWYGKNKNQKKGMFPGNHLEYFQDFQRLVTESLFIQEFQKKSRCIAIDNYLPPKNSKSQLKIEIGDIFEIISPQEKGWILVKNLKTNQEGFVPESFIQEFFFVKGSTGQEELNQEQNQQQFTTLSPSFDSLLRGGIYTGKLLEICGLSGTGKSLPIDSFVVTKNGFYPNGKLFPGMFVCNSKGGVSKILAIFPQEKKLPVYKIIFSNGDSVESSLDHLWVVNNELENKKQLVNTQYLYQKVMDERNLYSFSISTPKIVFFSEKKLPIHPYLFGSFIAYLDCSFQYLNFQQNNSLVSIRFLLKLLGKYSWRKKEHLELIQKLIANQKQNLNQKIKCSIPKSTIFNSKKNRFSFIQGLFDFYYEKNYIKIDDKTNHLVHFINKKKIGEKLKIILESFGGISTIKKNYSEGEINQWICEIQHKKIWKLFKIYRDEMKEKTRKKIRTIRRKISQIVFSRKVECLCVLLDSPDHLYLTNHFVVTHNTQLAMQLSLSVQLPLSYHGLNAKCVYIDTGAGFSISRMAEIADGISNRLTQNFYLNNFSQIDLQQVSNLKRDFIHNIYYYSLHNHFAQLAILNILPDLLKKDPQIKLIIFDNISFFFKKSVTGWEESTQIIGYFGEFLLTLAAEYQISEIENVFPSLGELWQHYPNQQLILFQKLIEKNQKELKRQAILTKSSFLPKKLIEFEIKKEGIF
ncbi:intein-containing DNA repair protein rad51 precursor [Anaeramoeba ignava]|uniref:DNA repair protein RAD51 homolog 3 n=1 Tax=Anaeramoeba ignava TaxID=1746090 RepID=A0A9Q0L6E0_ANAIG|nr:intein-containing DNA repair protein rad51 precursor [Anaeramoeba ignava]